MVEMHFLKEVMLIFVISFKLKDISVKIKKIISILF